MHHHKQLLARVVCTCTCRHAPPMKVLYREEGGEDCTERDALLSAMAREWTFCRVHEAIVARSPGPAAAGSEWAYLLLSACSAATW